MFYPPATGSRMCSFAVDLRFERKTNTGFVIIILLRNRRQAGRHAGRQAE